jgi:arabinose-5-phosphate isomerase
MLAMGDALAMALMKRRNFTISDYAKSHPAGELGKKSFTAKEVMRGKDAVAFVSGEDTVGEVIEKISHARAGAAIVVDHHGKLLGIFTDGDLRRAIIKDELIMQKPVINIMVHTHHVINESAPASEALAIMRENRIGEMPVINDEEKVVGMIDLKGLLAAFNA